MEELTLKSFEEAAEKVKEATLPTNLVYSEYFSSQTGNRVYLKPENMQYTGAYKVRGAYYKISTMSEEARQKGLITASAGNHAQGVAFAAKKYGVKATVVMPTTTPLIKVNRTKGYGAEVILYGNVYDEACEYAMKLAKEKGLTFVHPFDDLDVATGQGSIAMEIIKELPTVDYILVPIGGGGLATGVSTLAKLLVGTMLLMALVINPFIIFIYLHRNPYPLVFRCLRESGLTAFFTRSSAANIPVNMSLCEKLSLDKDIYSVSIPLGATINMDGAAITITIMTLAAANTLGMQVSVPAAILLSIMSALGACGASGVAGGSLLLIPMACSLFGISNDIAMQVVGVGFIIGVIQDSVETALNSAGDVEFAATAEYHQWLKEDKPLPAFMGGK